MTWQTILQGSQTQRNGRSSMSDPDMFLNYTPTFVVSDVGKQAQLGGTARHAFPEGVHVPEGEVLIAAAFILYPPPAANVVCPLQDDM